MKQKEKQRQRRNKETGKVQWLGIHILETKVKRNKDLIGIDKLRAWLWQELIFLRLANSEICIAVTQKYLHD